LLNQRVNTYDRGLDVISRASFPFPLRLDPVYEITICTDCCIGIPFDWIEAHMKDTHGLTCSDQQIFECLHITTPTMKSDEAEQWLRNNQVIKTPIEGVPVLQGVGCSLCPHSAKKRKTIYNHISSTHKDESSKATIVERKVQQPFESRLHKYIQVDATVGSEVEDEGIEDWESKLKEEFNQLVEGHNTIENRGSLDLRLINAFIAKIRYKFI